MYPQPRTTRIFPYTKRKLFVIPDQLGLNTYLSGWSSDTRLARICLSNALDGLSSSSSLHRSSRDRKDQHTSDRIRYCNHSIWWHEFLLGKTWNVKIRIDAVYEKGKGRINSVLKKKTLHNWKFALPWKWNRKKIANRIPQFLESERILLLTCFVFFLDSNSTLLLNFHI